MKGIIADHAMYFFFHFVTGIIIGLLIRDFTRDDRWLLPCIVGAILPDLIDKPVGYLLFPTTIGYGRIYNHTLLIALLVLAIGLTIWKLKKDPGVIALGMGILSHQILDLMWRQPQSWYYPFFGPFQAGTTKDYFFTMLMRELNNPFERALVFILATGIIVYIYRHRILSAISNNRQHLSTAAAACALILCIISGIIIGLGSTGQSFLVLGWSRPEELLIGGVVIALAAYPAWRWHTIIRSTIK
ncbi:MAG: metal-dependent hydrolase [Methanoregula sp.]|jgi:hypothetical protein|nr:metal-dependent hydrolase [Methanoregula sp.]